MYLVEMTLAYLVFKKFHCSDLRVASWTLQVTVSPTILQLHVAVKLVTAYKQLFMAHRMKQTVSSFMNAQWMLAIQLSTTFQGSLGIKYSVGQLAETRWFQKKKTLDTQVHANPCWERSVTQTDGCDAWQSY